MKHPFLALLTGAFLLTAVTACVKDEFDAPPTGGNGQTIPTNATIRQIKALHVTPGGFDKITDSLVIGGQVVMDDRSGNYYKTLVIQDSTGGIEVKFNDGFLYNQFPVGRTVYIRLKDLYLTDYNDLTQLIGSVVEQGGIPDGIGLTEAQVRTNVVKGPLNGPPTPKVRTIGQISEDDLSTLIQLQDVEFIHADTGETYAEPVTQYSLNRTLEDCSGQKLIVRTSGFANFAGAITPRGKGTVTGVLGIFNGTYQLYLRDLSDVKLDSLRCGEVVIPATGLLKLDETFSSVESFEPVGPAGWLNLAVQGAEFWEGRQFQNNGFAQVSAFQASPAAVESWLISPPLDVRTAKTLSFRSSWGFYVHQGLSVRFSTDFNGQNPAAATWTTLNPVLADANTPKDAPGSNYSVWVNSGDVSLPVFNGKGYVAFVYTGNAGGNTTTWRVDDVKVQ
jgi:hypothetical protein